MRSPGGLPKKEAWPYRQADVAENGGGTGFGGGRYRSAGVDRCRDRQVGDLAECDRNVAERNSNVLVEYFGRI